MTVPARELVQLVNKDLWRGRAIDAKTNPAPTSVPVTSESPQHPLDRAMATVLAASAGAQTLTCVWCGLQGDPTFMREHLKKDHKSVVEPAVDAAVALFDAQNARAELAASKTE